MADLQKYQAKICLTAAGVLIHQDKVLLIKHRKLNFWMCPGGHLEDNELPHAAAEREFFEETGIKVKSVDYSHQYQSNESEYLPSPFETNLHWISQSNYQKRIASSEPDQRVTDTLWPLGCEQHVGFVYLVEPVGSLDFSQNIEETLGIAWFTQDELTNLETTDDIRHQLEHAFSLVKQHERNHD